MIFSIGIDHGRARFSVITNVHSAAVPRQCNSRFPPGLSRIDTPATLCENQELFNRPALFLPLLGVVQILFEIWKRLMLSWIFSRLIGRALRSGGCLRHYGCSDSRQ